MRRLTPSLAVLAALATLAACAAPVPTGPSTRTVRQTAGKTGDQPAAAARALATLTGVARTPARLLTNNGGSVVSSHGAGLVSNNSGGLVANNSGGLVSNNAAGYGLLAFPFVYTLQDAALVPVADATAVLVDGFRHRARGVQPVKTDAQGGFSFDKVPTGTNWIVEVQLPGFALTAIAAAGTDAPIAVTPASTIVTEHLRTQLDDKPAALRVVQPTAFSQLTGEVEKALAVGDVRVDLSSRATAAQTFDQIVAKAPELAERSAATVSDARTTVEQALAAGKLRGNDVEPREEAIATPPPDTGLAEAAARISAFVAGRAIGAPWDQGAGAAPHRWHGLATQWFYGGAETDAHCVVVDGPAGPRLVRNAFYDSWVSAGQCWSLGAPLEDDAPVTEALVAGGETFTGRRQRFERGTLFWSAATGMLTSAAGGAPVPAPAYASAVHYPPEGVTTVRVTTLCGADKGEADGSASEARFSSPWGMAAAADGTLYVADRDNGRVRRVSPNGVVATLKGPNGQPLVLNEVAALAVAPDDTLFVVTGSRVMRVSAGKAPELVAGGQDDGATDGPGATARFRVPRGLALAQDGTLFVADSGNYRIRKIAFDAQGQATVSTVAGSTEGFADGAGGAAGPARFRIPHGIVLAGGGTLYVADTGNNAIRRISPAGEVVTLTGSGLEGGGSDGASAARAAIGGPAARFARPIGLAFSPDGDLYVTEEAGHAIRKIAFGTASSFTLAGTSRSGGFADGAGDQARFNAPAGIAVDRIGQIFIADRDNHRIRKVVPRLAFSEAGE